MSMVDDRPRVSGGERLPPQDIPAERSVLGSMMLSKDAIADVVEVVLPEHFYRPSHQVIYSAIIELYGRGEPADVITVTDQLQKTAELDQVGGAGYVTELTADLPTSVNAAYHAGIVRGRAMLRRLTVAGARIQQMGYSGEGEVDDLVNLAQAEIFEATQERSSEDYLPLGDILEGALTEIETIANRGGEMIGVPTGLRDLDQLTQGLQPGQFVLLAARPAIGKALALDTPIPTPDGWTTMGEVAAGDLVIGGDGRPTRVLATTDVMHDRPCYRVSFSDGSSILADEQHLWRTATRSPSQVPVRIGVSAEHASVPTTNYTSARPIASGSPVAPALIDLARPADDGEVRTTAELAATLRHGGWFNHSIPTCDALDLPTRTLPVAPHLLGRMLAGDRAALDSAVSPERARAEQILAQELPRIPSDYLRASQQQRRALLAGLLHGHPEFAGTGSLRLALSGDGLADDVAELAATLGYQTARTTVSAAAVPPQRRVAGKGSWHILDLSVTPRLVVAVEPIASVPVRCIQVDRSDGMFLAHRAMVPTHNSTLGLDVARHAAIKHGLTTVIFSLEMSRNEIIMRMLSAEMGIQLGHIRAGRMGEREWQKIASRQSELNDAPLFIDDSPNMTMTEIRAKCRRLKQRHDLRLIIVDYMQLMSSGKKVESRQQEVSEFSRAMKLLAKELEVPVIAMSQLNRGPEQRNDKKPMLSDLRESGSLEQDADVVLLIHREDFYDKENRPGEADLIVAKHRNGPTDTISVTFQGHYSRFVDLAG